LTASIKNPGTTLAEELRHQSKQDAAVTPMDAVLETALKATLEKTIALNFWDASGPSNKEERYKWLLEDCSSNSYSCLPSSP
jgi:hypothetical protein